MLRPHEAEVITDARAEIEANRHPIATTATDRMGCIIETFVADPRDCELPRLICFMLRGENVLALCATSKRMLDVFMSIRMAIICLRDILRNARRATRVVRHGKVEPQIFYASATIHQRSHM